jgi:RimJ/RimL family protein N-acetyltransferase/nucleotide-binding universal stress UspA family protein
MSLAQRDVSRTEAEVSELLVPVDLSHESWRVLPLATSIARRLAVPVAPLFVDAAGVGTSAALENTMLLRLVVGGEPVCVEVLPGSDVVQEIQNRANDRPGSAVAMATHVSGGLADRGWANTCEQLLQMRDASVLAVGPRFDALCNAEIRRVAVCIDAAAPDSAIVRDALGWATALDVPMVVVTVAGHGRSRPGEDATYHLIADIFDELPPTRVAVTAETLGDLDVAAAIVRLADRRPGTLLALAPGAAARAVHAMTHRVTAKVIRESRAPMLLRWHRPERTAFAPTPAMTVLNDAREVQIRPLTGDDGEALRAAIEHADGFDLYRRFMGSPPPTNVLVRMLKRADGVHDAAVGAFDPAGALVGVAQFDRVDDEPAAELAIEIASVWQRCGLGTALLHELAIMADARGITQLTAFYFADNSPMIRLLQATGPVRWVSTDSGASTAELDVRNCVTFDPSGAGSDRLRIG